MLLYDFRSAGAQAYVQLAGEFLKRERVRFGSEPVLTASSSKETAA